MGLQGAPSPQLGLGCGATSDQDIARGHPQGLTPSHRCAEGCKSPLFCPWVLSLGNRWPPAGIKVHRKSLARSGILGRAPGVPEGAPALKGDREPRPRR